MPGASLSDHIRVFDGALTPARCQSLIDRFERSSGHEATRREGGHSFVKLDVTRHWPEEHDALVPVFLSYFDQYRQAVEARYWPKRFAFESLQVKRYLPDGRDSFPPHVDVMGHGTARRFMTAIVYLNRVDGGETTFPGLGIAVAPEPGRLVAFPPLWMFPHAGEPPRGGPKYILHTYLWSLPEAG
jgi:hypothetical protein